jgi:microcystin degradation protein MlrC
MRILIGGVNHESNTLNPIITGPEDFVVYRGKEIFERGMLPEYASTGIINFLREAGCEVIPTVLARAVPNGVVSAAFYHALKDELIRRTREALEHGPPDGVCLALHGSMKVETLGCAEGDILTVLRTLLPEIPITVALDMHATVTPEMLRAADGFVGYKTAPHIDCPETGAHAARMLLKSLDTGQKLHTAWRRIPMLIAGEQSESEAEPMASLMEACREAEKQPGIAAASFLLGFPWADDEHNAAAVLVTGLGEAGETAEGIAGTLAAAFWDRRREFAFRGDYYDTAQALDAAYRGALEKKERPIFLSDSGDNPTAGAAGDATDLLERILETMDTVSRLPTPLLYSGFYDAPAVRACIAAGPGAVTDITIGGNWDTLNGKQIPLRVEVKAITRNFGPYGSDLVLAAHRNLLVTLTSKHIGFGDPELLPALGLTPEDHHIVAVKLGYLEPCFRDIARRAILAATRGCSNEILSNIPYKNIRRPIYPLDPAMETNNFRP